MKIVELHSERSFTIEMTGKELQDLRHACSEMSLIRGVSPDYVLYMNQFDVALHARK